MSIKDVIKNSVYEGFVGDSGLSITNVCLILFVALIVGMYIYAIYKMFTKSAFYSKDMNITLAGITVVVASIMVAMQSSLVVALGMVGALSIVRFRTAIKNPLDLLYLFWSVSAGIICGIGLYALVIVLCVMMTVLIYVLNRFPVHKAPSLVVIRTSKDCPLNDVLAILKANGKGVKENSVIVRNGERELIYEVYNPVEGEILNQMEKVGGIISINMLRHSGETRTQ